MKKCKHRRTEHRRWKDGAWAPGAFGVNCWPGWVSSADAAIVCGDCGAWLPLGPATITPEIEVEIRAAELAAEIADGRMPKCGDQPFEQNCERCGYENWGGHVECHPPWHAGYLARCIATHNEEP